MGRHRLGHIDQKGLVVGVSDRLGEIFESGEVPFARDGIEPALQEIGLFLVQRQAGTRLQESGD